MRLDRDVLDPGALEFRGQQFDQSRHFATAGDGRYLEDLAEKLLFRVFALRGCLRVDQAQRDNDAKNCRKPTHDPHPPFAKFEQGRRGHSSAAIGLRH